MERNNHGHSTLNTLRNVRHYPRLYYHVRYDARAGTQPVLGWRYDQQLATCIASNLTPEQIRRSPHYARLVDRWRETCDVVVIGGESQRRVSRG